MNELTFTTIELRIDEETSLYLLLHIDGTINRKGDGSAEIDKNLVIGMTDTGPMLTQLNKLLDKDFEQYLNKVFEAPEKVGQSCSLEIALSDGDKTAGTKFLYGSESMGPPPPIRDFVIKAIELTDSWYRKHQPTAKTSKKPWWQFWK